MTRTFSGGEKFIVVGKRKKRTESLSLLPKKHDSLSSQKSQTNHEGGSVLRLVSHLTAAMVLAVGVSMMTVGAQDAPSEPPPAAKTDTVPAPAVTPPAPPPADTPPVLAPGQVATTALPPLAEDAKTPMTLKERIDKSPKGTMRNPYTDDPVAIEEGKKIYLSYSCNGCHGGGGGGGMCPALTNVVWVYGDDDDTLFRLIALGSVELQKAGYMRKGREGVVGPMPPYLELMKTDQELWKIIAWIRTVFNGDPSRRHW